MAVKLVFLGRLADLAGESAQELSAPLDWSGLLAQLAPELGDAVADAKVRIAIDGAILPDKAQLSAVEGSEIAFLPPVSGG